MIQRVEAFVDSEGTLHSSWDEACRAEFTRALCRLLFPRDQRIPREIAKGSVPIDVVVEHMAEIGDIIVELRTTGCLPEEQEDVS